MQQAPTLKGNWYEERYYDADTRKNILEPRVRPKNDEVENIPRITRQNKPDADVYSYDADTPDRWITDKMASYVVHRNHEMTLTERRMNASPEYMAAILSCESPRYLPNYSLKPITPEEQFTTTNMEAFKRYI